MVRPGECFLADVAGILKHRRLSFHCDAPTEDLGNCFPYAIMQQLRRPEVRSELSAELTIFSENCHALRIAVVEFVRNISPLSEYFKPIHQSILGYRFAIGGSWEDRLEEMSHDGIWFDDQFMQFTSWFLKMDIFCHTSSFTKKFCASPVVTDKFLRDRKLTRCLVGLRTWSNYTLLMMYTDTKYIRRQKL